MSARSGTFSRLRVSAVSRLAAISGKAAFLAPPIAITPSKRHAACDADPVHRLGSARRRPPRRSWSGSGPSIGGRPAVAVGFTGERCAAQAIADIGRMARALGLHPRLFLAPTQIIAQSLDQPFVARCPLLLLSRRQRRGLVHSLMQLADGAIVKRNPTNAATRARRAGRHRADRSCRCRPAASGALSTTRRLPQGGQGMRSN